MHFFLNNVFVKKEEKVLSNQTSEQKACSILKGMRIVKLRRPKKEDRRIRPLQQFIVLDLSV